MFPSTVMRVGQKMKIEKDYAALLLSASSVYAAQGSTACSKAECHFESRLLKLFEQAERAGVSLQDIAIIASTAIAVTLTKPDYLPPKKVPKALKGEVVALHPAHLQR